MSTANEVNSDEIVQMPTTYAKVGENETSNSPVSNKVEQGSPQSTSSVASTLVPENSWKIVGSPARRASIAGCSFETPSPPQMQNGSDNEMMQKKGRAASIATVPPPGLAEVKESVPSIWLNTSNASGKSDGDEAIRDRFLGKNSPETGILTEEEYLSIPKGRSRSKSSSAIFGFSNAEEGEMLDTLPDMPSIWGTESRASLDLSSHRRVSSQPSQQTLMWEALRAAQLATPNDMNGDNAAELLEKFKREHRDQQTLNPRRFSVAPSMVSRFVKRNGSVLQAPSSPEHQFENRRRHSTGPVFDRKLNSKLLSEGFEALGLDNAKKQLEKIDDYFENTESRSKAFREAGKNLQANHDIDSPVSRSPEVQESSYTWPLYVVEFKAGRTDYFYLPAELSHLKINVGDLAIVEADRGKDLGKVIETSINSMNELQLYQATHEDPLVDSHNAIGKEIQPKRLFRLAEANEVAMLLQKGQDESKANKTCQIKIREKRLPMEIVDAEYQWDRRKLTFYFVADRRIDFRELVRELFKIYKSRIWMCAVQPRTPI